MSIYELINKLNRYTKAYDEGHPLVSDKEWDDLYFELKQREEKTGIIYPNSPTQKINYEVVSQLNKVEHNHPMLSLDKTKDINDIVKFFHGQEFICMFKMDGLTVSLTYEDGKLVRAETRGDGRVGEDVTHNARVVENIPQTIPDKNKIIVDGEIICRKDHFEEFKEEYKNPRNFAAGSIRLLSAEECAKRKLSFIAWDLIDSPLNMVERIETLTDLGFTTVPYLYGFDVKHAFDYMEEIDPDNLDNFVYDHDVYPTDGYVFKFNDVEYGNSLGQTDHHFKNAIALKLYDETYSTTLKAIEWTMGRTGVLTPIAIFEPLDIDGSIVERASLHNVNIMTDLLGECPYINEPIEIYKANQIIPQVAAAAPKYDYLTVIKNKLSPINKIEYCPICNHKVEYITSVDGVINAYCSNPDCEGKLLNRVEHFCSKKGLDIKGLSKATFEKLIDWEWITCLYDIFRLHEHRTEWINKTGFGVASVDKILKAIEEKKNNITLDGFIAAIGIPLIGRVNAQELAKAFKTYKDFKEAINNTSYSFTALNGFGYEMNESLKNFDYTEADKIACIIHFKETKNNNLDNSLMGITICITGKLTYYKNRDEFKYQIEKHGGKVVSSMSLKTNILVNNDIESTSSKNVFAHEHNISIMSEENFIKKYF